MCRWKRLLLPATVAAAMLVVTGCGRQQASQTKAPAPGNAVAKATVTAEQGKDAFNKTCAACHGTDGKGMPHLGKNLTTSAFVKAKTDAQLVEFLKKGRPATDPANTTHVAMPPKGGNPSLTDADLLAIVKYIRSLQK